MLIRMPHKKEKNIFKIYIYMIELDYYMNTLKKYFDISSILKNKKIYAYHLIDVLMLYVSKKC